MANLTDPRIVSWSNQRGRTMADQIEIFVSEVQAYLTDWAAQGINALIVAGGNTNLVGDNSVVGSPIDGRQQITGLSLQNLQAAVSQLNTALVTTAVSGVGATPKAVADGIQVNGSQGGVS